MGKRLLSATEAAYEELQAGVRGVHGCTSLQKAAQVFADTVYARYYDLLVLLRLFMTVRYDLLPEDDRLFVDGRGRATDTLHLFRATTPIFTLLGTRGKAPAWNDRNASEHFRCIPLASSAFVASLSMLSRQFESVGFDLELIDAWETRVAASGRADSFRGTLYIRDAAIDRDSQGRMIVPKQEFVAMHGVKSVFGFGSGYGTQPVLVTLFAFTDQLLAPDELPPLADLLELFIVSTELLAGQERFF